MGRPIKHFDDPILEAIAERKREASRKYNSRPEIKEKRKEYMRRYQKEHPEKFAEATKRSRLKKVLKEKGNGQERGDSSR